jgi:hypothetical protein
VHPDSMRGTVYVDASPESMRGMVIFLLSALKQ